MMIDDDDDDDDDDVPTRKDKNDFCKTDFDRIIIKTWCRPTTKAFAAIVVVVAATVVVKVFPKRTTRRRKRTFQKQSAFL